VNCGKGGHPHIKKLDTKKDKCFVKGRTRSKEVGGDGKEVTSAFKQKKNTHAWARRTKKHVLSMNAKTQTAKEGR